VSASAQFQAVPFHAVPFQAVPVQLASFHDEAAPDQVSDTVTPIGMLIPNNGWLSVIGVEATARCTSKMPWPSTKGSPTGPACVEASSVPLTVFGVYEGSAAKSRAAAPLTTAALNEVPEPTKLPVPTRAEGYCASMVEPGSRRLMTERPDDTRSGLNHPSGLVGPTLLNVVMLSVVGLVWPPSSTAPTVMTSGSSPGERMLPLPGPELPAETTTAMPDSHAFSTAWSRGSTEVDSMGR